MTFNFLALKSVPSPNRKNLIDGSKLKKKKSGTQACACFTELCTDVRR